MTGRFLRKRTLFALNSSQTDDPLLVIPVKMRVQSKLLAYCTPDNHLGRVDIFSIILARRAVITESYATPEREPG